MLYLRLLLFCFSVFAVAPLQAQGPQQSVRLELPHVPESSRIELMALPDSSLLLYNRKTDAWLRNPTFILEKYDAQLEVVWSTNLELKSEDEFVRHFTESPYTYLVFQKPTPGLYNFVRVHNGSGLHSQSEVLFENADFLLDFHVLRGKHFIVAGNNIDSKPKLFYLDPEDPKPVMLPSVSGNESSFSDMLAIPEHRRLDVILSENNGRIARLQVKSFDDRGKLLHNYFILQKDNRNLLHAEISPGDTLSRILIGTYTGSRELRTAKGFFTAPVASQEVDGEFYSFLQLQNFFKFMKPRREERIRKRELARIAEGKEPHFRYRMLMHDLIVTPYGYVLAAEMYFPQQGSNVNYFDVRIRGAERQRHVVNYKRTHAVALGFDKDGILLWDNVFKLSDVVTHELFPALEVASLPDGRFVMAYPERDKIHYRLIEQDKYSDEETELELLPYNENEKITTTDFPGLMRWYGSHFAAFGYQHIRNPNGPNRTVFYINKITF